MDFDADRKPWLPVQNDCTGCLLVAYTDEYCARAVESHLVPTDPGVPYSEIFSGKIRGVPVVLRTVAPVFGC